VERQFFLSVPVRLEYFYVWIGCFGLGQDVAPVGIRHRQPDRELRNLLGMVGVKARVAFLVGRNGQAVSRASSDGTFCFRGSVLLR
jgi:hypothetical protein